MYSLNIRKAYLILFFILSVLTSATAQEITGYVKDNSSKPVSAASVSLLESKTNVEVKITVTDAKGFFYFTPVDTGTYIISATAVGKETAFSNLITVAEAESVRTNDIVLSNSSEVLDNVEVEARKPAIIIRPNQIIFNVQNSASSVGSDVIDLLRKLPGVVIDKDDNINLSGKTGVQVYIDGKPVPLTGHELSDYLHSIQSAQIDVIELMTNPSVQYEAAGNAGIINIRLKKESQLGINGSLNTGYAIGIYPKYSGGFNINVRNKVSNFFGNINYSDNKTFDTSNFFRTVGDSGYRQKTNLISHRGSWLYKTGVDFFLNRKNTLGVLISGSDSKGDLNFENNTDVYFVIPENITKILRAKSVNEINRSNINPNFNYQFADTLGKELDIDFDYGRYNSNSIQTQPNKFYDGTGQILLSNSEYEMLSSTTVDIYSLKIDYTFNIFRGKIGMGVKLADVRTNNLFNFFEVLPSGNKKDSLLSNSFLYKEKINAGYLSYNKTLKNVLFQAGLRLEATKMKGKSLGYQDQNGVLVLYDTMFNRSYIDLFPNVSISFNKHPERQTTLSFSRRIDRPAYQDLNPFLFRLDEYTYQRGNTSLRPQYTNTLSLSHSFKYKIFATLRYSHINGIIAPLVDTIETVKSFVSKRNFSGQDNVSLTVSVPFTYKKYSFFTNLNSFYSKYTGDFGSGRKINLDVFSFLLNSQHTYKLKKSFTLEANGWYAAPSIWGGTFKSSGVGAIDVGIQKSFLKGNAKLKLAVSDVFKTLKLYYTSDFAGQQIVSNYFSESRQFKLNFSYRFGNERVRQSKQEKKVTNEELKRAEGGNNGQFGD